MRPNARGIVTALAAALLAPTTAPAAETLTTVRFGEQDSCKVTGVTTLTYETEKVGAHGQKLTGCTIRFDLARLPRGARVKRALLRQWVQFQPRHAGNRAILAHAGHYSVERWRAEKDFDGFKVRAAGDKPGEPLDVVFPFAYGNPALHEWDVTAAVQAWANDPAANKGLRLNVPLFPADFEYAWMRPYLQVTWAGPNPNRPRQPTRLAASVRPGQVFLTWKQVPHPGAFFDSTYRVYMHDEPITAANLHRAERLGEVHRLSQLNYRKTVQSRGLRTPNYGVFSYFRGYVGDRYGKKYEKLPRFNFVVDDAWPQGIEGGAWLSRSKAFGKKRGMFAGPALSDDTGLFVHTVGEAGKRYFAVTSVVEGNENRQDFAAGNALSEPVEAAPGKPRPVLQAVYYDMERRRTIILEYVFWGGPSEGLHIEPSTPFYFHMRPPQAVYDGADRAKGAWTRLSLSLGPNVGPDLVYVPPTRLAPIPPTVAPWAKWTAWHEHYYPTHKPPASTEEIGFRAISHGSRSELNRFGYHDRLNTGADPRRAAVRPFRENVLLRCLEYYLARFPRADRNRVCAMSEGNVLMLGLHHPDVFASIGAGQEAIWTGKRKAETEWRLVGLRQWDLKTPDGHSVWEWNDPVWYSRKFPRRVWPFVDMLQSPNYARADDYYHWIDCGYPRVFLELARDKRGGRWWWVDIGDAPSPANPAVPMNEPYLAFTNVNFGERPLRQWRKCPRGSLNGYLVWQSPSKPYLWPGDPKAVKAPRPEGRPFPYGGRRPDGGYRHRTWSAVSLDLVDEPGRFAVGVRIGDHGRRMNGPSVPPTVARFGRTDITPWRMQRFKPEPGRKYVWTNTDAATGALVQSGVVAPDDRGLLTVPGFYVSRQPLGSVLAIVPADGKAPPKADEGATVAGLPHPEYVRKCRRGIAFPKVPADAPFTCKASEFVYVAGGEPDGSVGIPCGSFGGAIQTQLDYEKAGRYVFEARARATRGVCWPTLGARLGGWGTRMGVRRVASDDWRTYRWLCEVGEAGLNPLRLYGPADYYRNHWLAGLGTNKLQVRSLTVRRVADADVKTRPVDLRISPDFAEAPAGMPLRCRARPVNALGEPVEGKVTWSAAGGTIGPDGLLASDKPGACTVTAGCAGLAAEATIVFGERFVDCFDEGNGVVGAGWQATDLGGKPAAWKTPDRGHFMLNSLGEYSGAPSMLVWTPASPWTDCTVRADMICRGQKRKAVYGLVFRAAGGDAHCRLEVHRDGDAARARLVQVAGGKQTVLAEQKDAGPLAPLDWKTNPTFSAWHKLEPDQGAARAKSFGVDRMKVELTGGTVRAWLNGKALFADAKVTLARARGAFGLYSASRGNFFDNVVATGPAAGG